VTEVTPKSMFGYRVETCYAAMWTGWYIVPGPEGGYEVGYFGSKGERKPSHRPADGHAALGLFDMVRWIAEAIDRTAELEAFGYKPGFSDLMRFSSFEGGYRVDLDPVTFWERVQDMAASGNEAAARFLSQAERKAEGPFRKR